MDPRLKSQDTVFEALEKGNFIAPPGGDDRDLEDIPPLRRAMALILPGELLALLLPGILGGTLLPFLGAVILIFGYLRVAGQNLRFKLSAATSFLQVLVLAFCLLAESTMSGWTALWVYPIAMIAAPVLAALAPCLMALGLRNHRNCPLPAILLALCGVVLTALYLAAALLVVRIGLAVVGAGMLVWLRLITTHSAPFSPAR